jgi:formate-dependent phosphoribosylglycinamide formyltransferase (GAR transformylase)
MGVALARGSDIDNARQKASHTAGAVTVEL